MDIIETILVGITYITAGILAGIVVRILFFEGMERPNRTGERQ